MINNNSDLYAVLDELVSVLAELGASELVSALETSLGISSLPGEVLGEIRIRLIRVRESPFFENSTVQSKVSPCIKYIDRVLDSHSSP